MTRHFIWVWILVGVTTTSAQVVRFEGLKAINGTQLYVRVIGKGEPIIIIHGGPGMNHTYFLPYVDILAKKYLLIYFDQRASGRSAVPSADSVSLDFFVHDIEALRRDLNLEKVTVLGHSWGAIPAVQYTLDFPGRVSRLILSNPTPLSTEFNQEMAAAQIKRMTRKDSAERAQIMGSTEFKGGQSSAYKRLLMLSFRHSFQKPSNLSRLRLDLPENYVAASRALFTGLGEDLGKYNFYPEAKGCSVPVLIIHGAADAIPIEAIAKTRDSFPRSSLVVFKASGHFPFIEEQERFRKEVTSFVSKKVTTAKGGSTP